MAEPRTVVVKVGGSLFDFPPFAERLAEACRSLAPARLLLVAGGGTAAEIVRRWDDIHDLGDETAHWLAIRAMSLGEDLLASLLPESSIVSSRGEAETVWNADRTAILQTYRFLRDEESAGGNPLPRSWKITSDSIAAWVAEHWPADELVLLKSVPLTADASAVDEQFPRAAARIPRITWVNLRGESLEFENYPVQR